MKKITLFIAFFLGFFISFQSFSQTGTIDFSTTDNTNLGATADDGEGGSSDISGVTFNIFIGNGSGIATGGNIFTTTQEVTMKGFQHLEVQVQQVLSRWF